MGYAWLRSGPIIVVGRGREAFARALQVIRGEPHAVLECGRPRLQVYGKHGGRHVGEYEDQVQLVRADAHGRLILTFATAVYDPLCRNFLAHIRRLRLQDNYDELLMTSCSTAPKKVLYFCNLP